MFGIPLIFVFSYAVVSLPILRPRPRVPGASLPATMFGEQLHEHEVTVPRPVEEHEVTASRPVAPPSAPASLQWTSAK
jgi:hypothetical protein